MKTKEQLTLDVICKRNTSYLPSMIEFSNFNKKMEVARHLGMKTDEEIDNYLGNHIKWTAQLDDVPTKQLHDAVRMQKAVDAGRIQIDYERNRVTDPWGMEFALDATGYNNLAHPLQGLEDNPGILNSYVAPRIPLNSHTSDLLFQEAEKDLSAYSGNYLVMVSGYNGIWEKSYNLVGMEDFMCLLITNPGLACAVMDLICEYKINMAYEIGRRGFRIGHYGDDLGTQVSTLFSEEIFVKYLKPRIARVFAAFKKAGLPIQMHSCGAITPFIPHLIEIGLDVLEPVQTCMDIRYLKQEYGQDLTFYGGIDTQRLLTFGTPEQVKEETLRTIDILGHDGGYICGPSQEIMDNVPVENVIALADTINEVRGK